MTKRQLSSRAKCGNPRFSNRALFGIGAVVTAVLIAMFAYAAKPPVPGQASITLKNCDAKFCYAHQNLWDLTKEVTGNTVVDGAGKVTWTVTATKTSGDTTFTVHGGLTVTNTGTAPATI